MVTKTQIAGYVSDIFADFLYYDRKEDEDFTVEDAENLPNIIEEHELMQLFEKHTYKIYANFYAEVDDDDWDDD